MFAHLLGSLPENPFRIIYSAAGLSTHRRTPWGHLDTPILLILRESVTIAITGERGSREKAGAPRERCDPDASGTPYRWRDATNTLYR
jgi:hypothetical protein